MEEVSLDFVTYINAPPELVWQALTRPEYTKLYFFGRTVESDWREGSAFVLRMEDGRIDTQGKVVRCEPPSELEVTWHVEWLEEYRHLPEVNVRYRIDQAGEVVRLTVSQIGLKPVDETLLEGGKRGWPMILSGLKTLLETGHPLPAIELPPEEALPGVSPPERNGRSHNAHGG